MAMSDHHTAENVKTGKVRSILIPEREQTAMGSQLGSGALDNLSKLNLITIALNAYHCRRLIRAPLRPNYFLLVFFSAAFFF